MDLLILLLFAIGLFYTLLLIFLPFIIWSIDCKVAKISGEAKKQTALLNEISKNQNLIIKGNVRLLEKIIDMNTL